MLITKLKFLSITLFILLSTLTVSPAKACEPPGPGITWYHSQLTIDPVTLPNGIELNSGSTTSEEREQNSLSLTNNSDRAVYILHSSQKESELRDLYQSNKENRDWTQQIEAINNTSETRTTIIKIDPTQTQLIYQGNPTKLEESFAKWPMDYGGHRPDDVMLPDSIKYSIILAHQDGVQMIPITESIVRNPDYPAHAIWDGCDDIYDYVTISAPTPTPIVSEDTAVSTTSSSSAWAIVGLILLAIMGMGIYKWK